MDKKLCTFLIGMIAVNFLWCLSKITVNYFSLSQFSQYDGRQSSAK